MATRSQAATAMLIPLEPSSPSTTRPGRRDTRRPGTGRRELSRSEPSLLELELELELEQELEQELEL